VNGLSAVRPLFAFLAFAATSCGAAENASAAPLPADLTLNEDAGRGGWLLVTAGLENGKEALLALDTGSSHTVFDRSFEANLKKLPTVTVIRGWDGNQNSALYEMPKLTLGKAVLLVDGPAATIDLKSLSALIGRHIDGVLGMNCLRHYCLQLDFGAGKIRFFASASDSKQTLGTAFAMTDFSAADGRPSVDGNLAGAASGRSIIDTGDNSEGWLRPEFYRQWTNRTTSAVEVMARSPSGKFGGETYPEMALREAKAAADGIGLRFLSRHLATFDFPNHTLYLKRTSDGPLPSKGVAELLVFVKELKARGQLPGWSKDEPGLFRGSKLDTPFDGGTVETQKTGDPSTYHYTVRRASVGTPWKLERAWRTDQSGTIAEEYQIK